MILVLIRLKRSCRSYIAQRRYGRDVEIRSAVRRARHKSNLLLLKGGGWRLETSREEDDEKGS